MEAQPRAVAVFVQPAPSVQACTGVLVTPNMVLTARHCVAVVEKGTGPNCGPTGGIGGAAHDLSDLGIAVEGRLDLPVVRVPIAEIMMLPDSEGQPLCGADIALVRLEHAVDAPVAVPRLDRAPTAGEPCTVVGYGSDGNIPSTAGLRRASPTLALLHVGALSGDAGEPLATDRDVVIAKGICHGDSGAPLFDADGRIVGIASRGATLADEATCTEGVFTRLDVHADWLRSEVRAGVRTAGFAVPAWAEDTTPDAGPDGGAPTAAPGSKGGCSSTPAPPPRDEGARLGACVALAALFVFRRQPRSRAPRRER